MPVSPAFKKPVSKIETKYDPSLGVWLATCSTYNASATGQTADLALSNLSKIVQLYETKITAVVQQEDDGTFFGESPQLGQVGGVALHDAIALFAELLKNHARGVLSDDE